MQETTQETLENYVSVSEYSKLIGKSTQMVYNMIDSGVLEAICFTRGTMKGWLVRKPSY